ncbi:FtsW/RodA/SpoVE family cell cycle protein [Gottfriedia acidiceleris]|uniref:Probable peptidoglycan glycosyltransferase FtsW n=1 Tax=Gottfriedia acidiceleris TaxID=371036 RepID=A0ABY4JH89_9BACI|nr:FtsW/RodA/SpoVE family cell cycle protein [Gottfriedia acidiceleris]UPM53187.1 FtsW/RodA/SpoVE family cell cycle protein [Gottfriedia acidiceleris]
MLKKYLKNIDYMIFVPLLVLCLFGLIMVYSASSPLPSIRYQSEHWPSDYFFHKQLVAFEVGMFAFVFLMFLPATFFRKRIALILNVAVSIGLLIAVLLFGEVRNNAKSWVFGIQPAELIKLGSIVLLAGWYSKRQKRITKNWKMLFAPWSIVAIYIILLRLQPDTGTALLIIGTCAVVSFCSGFIVKRLILLFVGGIGLLYPLISICISLGIGLTDVQVNRFLAFRNPFDYAQGIGFQIVNSLIAFANGGLTGVGLGKSIQKLGYLPEPHTDFILAIIGEETGLIGVIVVILCIFIIVWRGLLIAHQSKDSFDSLLATGISAIIVIQSFVNIGGVTSLIPLTGVPLPFVSYGGTSLIVMLSMVGILMNISIRNKIHKETL